jgi:predicted RNase H-like HicB family nuclease
MIPGVSGWFVGWGWRVRFARKAAPENRKTVPDTFSSRFKAVNIEIEREDDGRWIAEVPDLPGVMVYGHSREEAISKVKALALRVLADRLEHGESIPELGGVFAVPA